MIGPKLRRSHPSLGAFFYEQFSLRFEARVMQAVPPLSPASPTENGVLSPPIRSPTKACQLTTSMIVRATSEGFENLSSHLKFEKELTWGHDAFSVTARRDCFRFG